jgi:four helix bundle protein
LKTFGWTPAFAGETNLRHRPFSSFRRKPESSGIEEEFDVYTITALLVIVWQKGHQFVLSIYRLTDSFPKNEIYGLTSQLRRADISISANIAEGFKKKTKGDKPRFMNIAQGSVEECRYYLILSKDLGYGDTEELMSRLEEISKLLGAYSSSILTSDS